MEKKLFNIDLVNTWISKNETKEDIEARFKILNTEMEKVYLFTLSYYNYLYDKRDYGNGIPMTMLEIHVLTDINDNPGITVTKIANKWKRTASSISQIIKNFYDSKLIDRVRNSLDGKVNNLFITEEGEKIVRMHKYYDNIDSIKTLKKLAEKVSLEEIEAFFNVIEVYKNIIDSSTKYKV